MNMLPRITAQDDNAQQLLLGVAGTANVRTPCGARRIENVRPGDLIVTRDNGLQPVLMVWKRTVTETDMAADPSLAPIRLKTRAVGPMMPQQDLLVARAHRILVPGYRLADFPDDRSWLIAARDIVEASDAAFVDKSISELTYYNLVFEDHQAFAANSLPVESFLPSPSVIDRLDEATSRDIAALFATGEAESKRSFPAPRYVEPESASSLAFV